MLNFALAVRFILELVLLAAFAWAGSRIASWPISILGGAGAAVSVAAMWGLFLSPKRRIELSYPARLALEAVLFVGTAWLLFAAGHRLLAAAILTIEIIDKAAVEWLQRSKRR